MKRFYSTNKNFQYHLHRIPNPPPPPPQKKNEKKMKISVYLEITENSLEKCAKYETCAYCTGFISYFAHFCTGFIFCTFFETLCFYQRPFGVNLLQNINKSQQAEKKINNDIMIEEKKKMDGCLNEEHVKYITWILSARHPYFG